MDNLTSFASSQTSKVTNFVKGKTSDALTGLKEAFADGKAFVNRANNNIKQIILPQGDLALPGGGRLSGGTHYLDEVADTSKNVSKIVGEGAKKASGLDYIDDQLGSMKNNVKINKYESAESVNDWWKNQGYREPPYTSKTVVQDLNLLDEGKFVRVYDKTNSNLHGGWLMKADDVKGLTPAQIQAKFSLPHLPEYVGEVILPKGTNLRMGEVNPLFGHKGGGVQFDLKGQYVGDFKEIGTIKEWSGLK